MPTTETIPVSVERRTILSQFLQREVKVDFYLPPFGKTGSGGSLLLINDGQDMATMNFDKILSELYSTQSIQPLLCVAIHAGPERRMEYGTQLVPDYKNRGIKAALYNRFIFDELLPLTEDAYNNGSRFMEKAFAGFSVPANSPGPVYSPPLYGGEVWTRMIPDMMTNNTGSCTSRCEKAVMRPG
jgi:enterochelin esterase-like enzyme